MAYCRDEVQLDSVRIAGHFTASPFKNSCQTCSFLMHGFSALSSRIIASIIAS